MSSDVTVASDWTVGRYGSSWTLGTTIASVTVFWGTTRGQGYVVRLPNGKDKDGFGDDVDAAQRFAERWLRKALTRSLAQLGERGQP